MAVQGCHLVGSVPFADTKEVFTKCLDQMPGRLKRIPDGETGQRHYFTLWQWFLLQEQAPVLSATFKDNQEIVHKSFSPDQVATEIDRLKQTGYKTGWDEPAISSYQTFKQMKTSGQIPKDVKFQVSLPTPVNTIGPFVEGDFQAAFEPIYEEGLWQAMRRIQDEIPHDELAIQIDLAVDTALWMGVYLKWWGKGDVKDAIVASIARMVAHVDDNVEFGFHNCYGDMEHKHWAEPTSLIAPVERIQRLYPHISRRVSWFHVPVPLSAMDKLETFLAPLKELVPQFQADGTELYLGLVHANDLEGTKHRIEVAKKVLGETCDFGVATECGWGRTPGDHLESIMEISKTVSSTVLEAEGGTGATINGVSNDVHGGVNGVIVDGSMDLNAVANGQSRQTAVGAQA